MIIILYRSLKWWMILIREDFCTIEDETVEDKYLKCDREEQVLTTSPFAPGKSGVKALLRHTCRH